MFFKKMCRVLLCFFATFLSVYAFDYIDIVEEPRNKSTPSPLESPNDRIVGGLVAEPHSIPHMILLYLIPSRLKRTSMCGGVVMDEMNVITAAHCIAKRGPLKILAYAGVHNKSKAVLTNSPTVQSRIVSKAIFHPKFNSTGHLDHDIGILHLIKPLKFNKYVQPVKMPKKDQKIAVFSNATVSGWGHLGYEGKAQDLLHVNQLKLRGRNFCRKVIGKPKGYMRDKICAGPPGKGICQGDSGGPLTVKGVLVGINSFVIGGDCSKRLPSYYSRVSFFTDWLNEKKARRETSRMAAGAAKSSVIIDSKTNMLLLILWLLYSS